MSIRSLASIAAFGSELLADPRPVGAAVPSSRNLARRVAAFVPLHEEGYVIELGAGTGAITAGLLEQGVSPTCLIPVERSETMANVLRRRFPSTPVVTGDASELATVLNATLGVTADQVATVVSSLPLRSLPKEIVGKILDQVHSILPPGGKFIQFTYDLRRRPNSALAAFSRLETDIVWFNIPPARVDVFQPIRHR